MFGRLIVVLLALLTVVPFLGAQESAPQPPATSSASSRLVLAKGTAVKLRFKQNLSSANAKPGDPIDFEVSEEVKVGYFVVIPKGSPAVGKVTDVQAARRMGRGGKLDVELDSVTLADGEKATIWAVKEDTGEGNVGDNRPIVAKSLVFGPVAPLVLLVEGSDAMISRDTEITGYIVAATPLDPARFPTTNPAALPPPQISAQLEITSDPSRAEISVDGDLVGWTPANIEMAPGRHTITISKTGCRAWERTLVIAAGEMTLAATLYPATLKIHY